jgi:two-component system cell cycle sensor histidine kinase/response regulator CckA
MVRNMGRTTLQRYGYRVLEAENGRAAVDLFGWSLEEIDLVILDLTMPVMSGEDTLAELKRIRPDIVIILSSGFSETEATLRFDCHDLAGFLQKPYTAAQLAEAVRSVMRTPQPDPTA